MGEDDLRARMKQRFQAMPMREWCRLTGCNASHVSGFMTGKRGPPGDLLAALNLRIDYVVMRKSERTTPSAQRRRI